MSDQEPRAQFRIERGEDAIRIRLAGALFFRDFPVANEIVEALDRMISDKAANVILDFAAVDWMDSHWLGFMVRVLHHAQKAELTVAVHNINDTLQKLFAIVKFNELFTIIETTKN